MKRLFRIACSLVAFLGFAIGSHAQTYNSQSVSLGVSSIAAGGTSNILKTLDVRRATDVAVELRFNCATATNVVPLSIVFRKSIDGLTWSDKDTYTWSYIRDGTTNSINASTNISVGGYGYLQLYTISAPGASGVVALESFKYSVKNPNR